MKYFATRWKEDTISVDLFALSKNGFDDVWDS